MPTIYRSNKIIINRFDGIENFYMTVYDDDGEEIEHHSFTKEEMAELARSIERAL